MPDQIQSFNPDRDAPVGVDFIVPDQGRISRGRTTMNGNWARQLLENELDPGSMRPFIGEDGGTYYNRSYVVGYDAAKKKPIIKNESVPIWNDSNATLRFLDWIQIDDAVIKASKPRLAAAQDLIKAGLIYSLPDGIAKTTIQYQQQTDITGATISMDGLVDGESDRPAYSLLTFPLPIIHKDFQYSMRQVMASRTGQSPLDTTTAELAGRRVAEQVEQLTLGCSANASLAAYAQLQGVSTYAWNNSNIYGYMNFPQRITYSLTLPTTGGWTPQATLDDVLAMKTASQQAFHFGDWVLYCGLYWDRYMDDDYKPTYNDMTLRERIRKIDKIKDVRTVDYIPDQSLILVQQSTDVVRMVRGMDITTVQWESKGGMQLNFKVMCVMVPQVRADIYGNTGIVHGS